MIFGKKADPGPKTYVYIARNDLDEVVEGELKALEENAAVIQLGRMGMEPISILEKGESILEKDINFFESVPPMAIYNFTRQLSVMMKAAVPLVDALESMQSPDMNPLLKKATDKIIGDVSAGFSLSQAMSKHPRVFNEMFVNIIKAGESAGVLDEVMYQLADFISHDLKLRMGITQAIRYPMIVIGITLAVGVYAVTFILPRFSSLFSSTRIALPLPTRILLGLDVFIKANYSYIIFGIFAFLTAFLLIIRTERGRYHWHKFLLSAPIIGPILTKMAISRFCHVLETLDRTGVPILSALQIAGNTVGNAFILDRVKNIHLDVEMGKQIAKSLNIHAADVFPAHVLKMISVGEDAGALDDMLKEIGDMTDEETKDHVLRLTATLEPLITVFMGIMILTLSLAIFLPIWDMYEALASG
tara:strand:- start:146 stop:1396 length:1251 start_codon:yes stop_codon:yes gene_type:complete